MDCCSFIQVKQLFEPFADVLSEALQLNGKKFSPSYLLSLDDQLLTYSFLKLCISAYVPAGADPDNDPLLSPNVASPEVKS